MGTSTQIGTARLIRLALGVFIGVELFYVIGHWLLGFLLPTPRQILDIFGAVALGTGLGVLFAWFWPLPAQRGYERVVRTLLLVIPAIGIGLALQLVLQGPKAAQALFLVFALAAWLGSGFIVRLPQKSPAKKR